MWTSPTHNDAHRLKPSSQYMVILLGLALFHRQHFNITYSLNGDVPGSLLAFSGLLMNNTQPTTTSIQDARPLGFRTPQLLLQDSAPYP